VTGWKEKDWMMATAHSLPVFPVMPANAADVSA